MQRSRISIPIIGLRRGEGGSVTLEQVLRRLPGIYWVYVNSATETAYVEYMSDDVSLKQIADAVSSAGFGTVPPEQASEAGSGSGDFE